MNKIFDLGKKENKDLIQIESLGNSGRNSNSQRNRNHLRTPSGQSVEVEGSNLSTKSFKRRGVTNQQVEVKFGGEIPFRPSSRRPFPEL